MKTKVRQFHPQTVSDLKDAIRTVIQDIPIEMVHAAVLTTICRIKVAWCLKEVMWKIWETQ